MEIRREGDQWLANQKTCASFIGISTKQFQLWNYEPVRREGRSVLYDVRAILNDLEATDSETSEELNLTEQRARLAREQADKTALENQKLRGDLVDIKEVKRGWMAIASIVRQRLLSMPRKLAPLLPGKTETEIEDEIDREVRLALDSIARSDRAAVNEAASGADGKRMGRRKSKAKQ